MSGGKVFLKSTGRLKNNHFITNIEKGTAELDDESFYVAYVSEQNLLIDETGDPIEHPEVAEMFGEMTNGKYNVTSHMN